MAGVVVRDDQRLVTLQPQRLHVPIHRSVHLPPVGGLDPRAAKRVVQHWLRQLPTDRRQVPGVGPRDPLRGLRTPVAKLRGVVQAERRDPGE